MRSQSLYLLDAVSYLGIRGLNIHSISLGLVVQVSSEQGKEVVGLGLEQLRSLVSVGVLRFLYSGVTCLLLLRVLDSLGKVGQGISHLSGGDVCGGVLEGLHRG